MQTRAHARSEPTSIPSAGRRMVVARGGAPTLRWALAGAGYCLLLLAWAFASPFGAAPDEPAHAVRAIAAAGGQFQGQAVAPYRRDPARTSVQADLLNQQAQQFTVPADLLPTDPCFAGRVDESAACLNAPAPSPGSGTVPAVTYTTTAPPGAYVLAGLVMRLPQRSLPPGYAGRLALALACALLLAGAAWAAAVRGALWPLAGVALAATPTVLFLGSAVGTAGVTAAAAICFTAAALAFWMGPPRRLLAPLIGVSGAVLALASAGGALALLALIAVVLPYVRPRRLTEPGALLASAVVTAALVCGVVLALDRRPLPAGGADLPGALAIVGRRTPDLLQQAVGVFGWTDVPLPPAAYGVWGVLVVAGVATALLLGRRRDRLALVLTAGLAVAVATGAEAFVLAPVDWDLRGSFVVPVLVALPLVAGFVLHAARVQPRADGLLIGAGVIGVQLFSLWENARRYAVGQRGPLYFLDSAAWAPPGGWLPWVAVAAAGGLLVLLALVPLTRREWDDEGAGPLVVVDPVSISR